MIRVIDFELLAPTPRRCATFGERHTLHGQTIPHLHRLTWGEVAELAPDRIVVNFTMTIVHYRAGEAAAANYGRHGQDELSHWAIEE